MSTIGATSKRQLVQWMVGRDLKGASRQLRTVDGPPVLTVDGLRVSRGDGSEAVRGVSFEIREGEMLGVAGVDGNGQGEMVAALTGLREPTRGVVRLNGVTYATLTPSAFVANGGAIIPEDRHSTGVALGMTVWQNLLMSELSAGWLSRWGWLDTSTIRARAESLVKEFDIRTPSIDALVAQLSGGNQQKAVIARELQRRPKLLIAAHPTRGLDVGAMEFVHGQLQAHRAAGGATLLFSADLDEILELADRIAVLSRGRFTDIIRAENATRETVGALMVGTE